MDVGLLPTRFDASGTPAPVIAFVFRLRESGHLARPCRAQPAAGSSLRDERDILDVPLIRATRSDRLEGLQRVSSFYGDQPQALESLVPVSVTEATFGSGTYLAISSP